MYRKLAKFLQTLYLHQVFLFLNILHTQFVKTKKLTLIFHSLNHVSLFSNESALGIRWLKYWNFSFSTSPSNEYSGLISFRINWFESCSPRDSQESSPTPQFESINSSVSSLLYGSTLTSIRDYWKHHSFDYMDVC